MPIPRARLVDSTQACYYHITSRCVRRAWLMGQDPISGKNQDHRKDWLIRWLHTITPSFAVSVDTYAIMSNHFHLVVYYDPLEAQTWSDEDVARRWVRAHPTLVKKPDDPASHAEAIEHLLIDPKRIEHCRAQLGSLSTFMKCLKQPAAQRANVEDKLDGQFWSRRFYSGAILSEKDLLSVMAYVDLNPIRAKITRSIEYCQHTGLSQRLAAFAADPERLHRYLAPCFAEDLTSKSRLKVTLAEYLAFVREILALEADPAAQMPPAKTPSSMLTRAERWLLVKLALKDRPRAIGDEASLQNWLSTRGFKRRERALPRF